MRRFGFRFQRVLDLNDAKGTFITDQQAPDEEVPLGQQVWDYLELEKN